MNKHLSLILLALASTAAAQSRPVIGLSLSTLNNPFFVRLRDGAKKAATAGGADLVVLDAQDRADKQASDIEDLITRKVKVIIVNATDSDAIIPSIAETSGGRRVTRARSQRAFYLDRGSGRAARAGMVTRRTSAVLGCELRLEWWATTAQSEWARLVELSGTGPADTEAGRQGSCVYRSSELAGFGRDGP